MQIYLTAVVLALLVGAGGTGLGALLAMGIRTASNKLSCVLLGIASGLMLSTVSLDMLPESWEHGGAAPFGAGLLGGIVVMWLVSRRFHHHDVQAVDSEEAKRIAHENLAHTGMLLAAGISVHNLPQGIAIGSGLQSGVVITLAVLLLFHNIPEGMAMALPLKIGRVSNGKIFYIAMITALPTMIGAVAGVALSEISVAFIGGSLAFAGGSMLYLTILELIPQGMALGNGKYTALSTIAGFALGGCIVWLLH